MWSAEQRRIALFPGTFDPFTLGHQSLVKRVLTCADAVVIAIGIKEEPRVKVITYSGLTVDVAQQEQASFILRGVRSVIDFEYEKAIADVNRQLTGIETLLLFTEPAYAHISSSVVRELLHFGKDVSAFLPK